MAVAKIYNSQTGQWEAVIVGETGATGATGPQGPAGNDGALSPNYIINGAFDIWQRGDGPTQIVSGSFLADRFLLYAQGPDFDVSKSTDTPDNFDFSTKIQRDSGSTDTSQATIQYIPEDAGRILAGKEFTISFYAKVGADFSGSVRLSVASTSAEPQNISKFTSGQIRSSNPDYNSSLLINPIAGLTTSWQRFSYTGTLDSLANGVQLFMGFVPSGTAGADDSFYITGVQLEAGSVATPFKRNANSIAGELAACQRYYQGERLYRGLKAAFAYARITIPLPTTMRTNPTITFKDSAGNVSKYSSYTSNDTRNDNRTPLQFISENPSSVMLFPTDSDSDTGYAVTFDASSEL